MSNNREGTIGGFIATSLASSTGILDARTFAEAVFYAIVGAVIGFLTNKVMKWADKQLPAWKEKVQASFQKFKSKFHKPKS